MQHDFFCKEEAALEFFTLLSLELFVNKVGCLYLLGTFTLLRKLFDAGIEPSAWPNSAHGHLRK